MRKICLLCAVVACSVNLAQGGNPATCPATPDALLAVFKKIREARSRGDYEGIAKYYSPDALISYDNGKVFSVAEVTQETKDEQRDNRTSVGEPEEVKVRFLDGVGILNFVQTMHNEDLQTGVLTTGSWRESRVFGCERGGWKVVFSSEVPIPNRSRVPVAAERADYDEFVGRYQFVQGGKPMGYAEVTRRGDKLFEMWGTGQAEELLPGGHDSFFLRYDGTVEQFVRNKNGAIVGIHYIIWDDDFEAKRVN